MSICDLLFGRRQAPEAVYPKPMRAPTDTKRVVHVHVDDEGGAPLEFPDRPIITNGDANERPLDAFTIWSIGNFKRIDSATRRTLVTELRRSLPGWLIMKFEDQFKRGVVLGSHNVFFHHNEGMAIRNILRDMLPDNKLPLTQYPGYPAWRNWDDCYLGALYEMVEDVR